MARRVELWDDTLVIPPALAARAAVFAFGDELIDLKLPNDADSQWLSQGGRDMAAAYLLPRAEAALRQELQRLADAVKLARAGQRSSSTVSVPSDQELLRWTQKQMCLRSSKAGGTVTSLRRQPRCPSRLP